MYIYVVVYTTAVYTTANMYMCERCMYVYV